MVGPSKEMANPFRYWGKAHPGHPPPDDWHPLPLHSLDVAAVAERYLTAHAGLLSFFARPLNLPDEVAKGWLVFLIALHDLGKFATTFQGQRPDLLARLQSRPTVLRYALRHDTLGAMLWNEVLMRRMDVLKLGPRARCFTAAFKPWIAAVAGHHGQPPAVCRFRRAEHFDEHDEQAAARYVTTVRMLLLPDDVFESLLAVGAERLEDVGQRLSWWLAGVTVLADWLGSNTRYFPYRAATQDLAGYWTYAQQQAEMALTNSGVLPVPVAEPGDIAQLFGWDSLDGPLRRPTPLQEWAGTVALAEGPQLYLLEDVTGAGKTEAALLLAQRLMAAGHADGIFVGLPTMATSNAMYTRVSNMAARLYVDPARSSVVLAHGQRGLVDAFRESVTEPGMVEADARQGDETATARCAAWLADNNKKSLLANVGVGTVDQALLAVLHARHQSLRLLGLFRKILIVDEVHACDAYMQRLLEGLLEFHGAAGGSAILLSATLSAQHKRALVGAFAKGAGMTSSRISSDAYPLATRIACDGPSEWPVDTRTEVERNVMVDYVDAIERIEARILEVLDAGHCVCWIRNTVGDAVDTWRRFAGRVSPEKLHLFHARFTLKDRLRIEELILKRFGPDSRSADRTGRLVVATQVIEQSLDVDFDLIVSDLAPIDRLVQRAGRMQRHARAANGDSLSGPDKRGVPCMVVFGPPWTETPLSNWYSQVFPRGAYVYGHAGQLWLTADLLRVGSFAMPDDARRLVEGVFGSDAQERIPAALQARSARVEGEAWAATNMGDANRLKLATGYSRGDVGEWWSDDATPALAGVDEWSGGAAATRLGEPTKTLRLAHWIGAVLVPWNADDRHPWEASSLRLPGRLIEAIVLDAGVQAAVDAACESLPDRGNWSTLVPLTHAGENWTFSATDTSGKRREWQYSESVGLMAIS